MAVLRINCPLLNCAPAVTFTLCQTYCALCKKSASAGGAKLGSAPIQIPINESIESAAATVDIVSFKTNHSPSKCHLQDKLFADLPPTTTSTTTTTKTKDDNNFNTKNASSSRSNKSISKHIPSILNSSCTNITRPYSKQLINGKVSWKNIFPYSKRHHGFHSLNFKSHVNITKETSSSSSINQAGFMNTGQTAVFNLSASRSFNFLLSMSDNKLCDNLTMLFSIRKYSKKSDGENLSDKSNNRCKSSKLEKSSKSDQADSTQLVNDPELKALLKEIQADFDKENQDRDKNSNFNASRLEHISNESEIKSEKEHVEDFSFYQVADDIEEYDYKEEKEIQKEQIRPEKVLPISLKRGKTGVFDLEEVIIFLDDLGAENIVSIIVPPEANFCDHMVVASTKSMRHMRAMHEELLWVHKRKKSKEDESLAISGIDDNAWSAMDMGNIVVHLFHGDAREYYDIESLWTLGPDLDKKSKDPLNKYELSAEDLFWMDAQEMERPAGEAAGKGDRNNAQKGFKPKE